MASQRLLLLNFRKLRTAIATTLASFLACALPLAVPVYALDPNKRLTQYMHTSWRTQDGSAPSGMYAIAQTSDGFLWFLSSRGDIYRFDGVQFRLWHPPANTEPIGRIRNILGDQAGGLWALGADGIAHLKNGVVTSQVELDGLLPDTNNVSEDADGSIWVVRGDNGVTEPVCHVSERGMKCFGKSDGIAITPIDAILADGSGGFWLGGQTALLHWHGGVSEAYPLKGMRSGAGPGILALARGPDGSVWAGIYSDGPGLGLAKFEEGTVRSFVTPTFDGSKYPVFCLRFDSQGNLWVGTDRKGIFRVRGNVVDHYGQTESLSGDFVRVLFEDRGGIVWAATNNGIDQFHDPRVTTFSALEGLGSDHAVGLLASRDSTIWVANGESLDHIVNGSVSSIRYKHGLPGQQVSSLLEDRAGNLWVGVDDALYLLKDGRFLRLPEPNHEPLGLVLGLVEDSDGSIWAECSGSKRKLVRIRDFKVQEEYSPPQVPIGRIAADKHGGIWIGTRSAELVLFRNGVQQRIPVNPGSKGPFANQVVAQADDTVLVAFDDGLVGLRQGKAQRMTTKNGLPCDGVLSFVQAKEKSWWLNMQCGVVEISDSELERWWANPEAVIQTRLYDVLDGARPSARSPFNSAATSPDGRVWFVNSGVVQMLDPPSLSKKALPAAAYLESVIVDRKEFAATDNLKLSPHPRDLQIDYTSPTFLIPQKVKFRYRLDGYDREWKDAGTRRQAFYTDLPPGRYSFRVIASNIDGVWNENAAELDFSVAPVYYQTNWFRALCAVLFLALLWAAYQWRVRQLQKQFEMTLDARVSERTRIARDLHDTLLQSFQGLLPRFQAAIYKLPETAVEARKTLEAAVDQASRSITEGRDAVQGLRLSTVETNDLAVAIRGVAEELASADTHQSSPAFQVAVQGSPRNLHPILRDEVYRIAAEALRNAFRHARAERIEAEIHYDEREFSLHVRDDGKGMDSSVVRGDGREGHFGLHGMRERAKLVGGKLVVWSEVNAGTEVELSIPASRAYTKPSRPFWLFRKLFKRDRAAKEKIEL
jgi:signal transduction histidine kinase/ligand-binding sensor domain-containing protein